MFYIHIKVYKSFHDKWDWNSHVIRRFKEDFDFEEINEKFNKKEVETFLAKMTSPKWIMQMRMEKRWMMMMSSESREVHNPLWHNHNSPPSLPNFQHPLWLYYFSNKVSSIFLNELYIHFLKIKILLNLLMIWGFPYPLSTE